MTAIKSIKIENLNGGTEAEATRINALPVFTNWAELNTEANRIMEDNLIFDITILITFEDKTTKRMSVDYMTYTKHQVNDLRIVNDTFQERLKYNHNLIGEFVETKETGLAELTDDELVEEYTYWRKLANTLDVQYSEAWRANVKRLAKRFGEEGDAAREKSKDAYKEMGKRGLRGMSY